ncbi:hypothetical protein GCM10028805_49710 [Spirosoma harenae]
MVNPAQTTTYTASCQVTSTTVTSSTGTSSTATSTTGTVTTTTTATGTIQVFNPIKASITINHPSCFGNFTGSISIGTTGGVGNLEYQLNEQGYRAENFFTNLRAATYSLSVRDTKGCVLKTTAEVQEPASLSASISIINTKCVGGTDGAFIAKASGGVGGYRYAIQGSPSQESGTFINIKADTTYTLIVSDNNTCVLFIPVRIGQPSPFSINLTPTPTRCAGSVDGSINVAVTGGAPPYQYQLGTGAFQSGTQFTGLAPTSYTVTIKDGNGCQGKQSVTISQPTQLKLTAVSKPVVCSGPNTGSIIVTPSGGTGAVTYQATANSTPQTSNILSGIALGNYTVVGTDANGCTSLISVTVGKVDPLKAQASPVPATCCTCPTGSVKLASTGGTGTGIRYQVVGQNLQTNSQITTLTPNTYRLRVVDDGGCSDTVSAVITDGNALTLSAGQVKDVSCAGGRNGEATIVVAGGKKPFTYYWMTERLDTLKPFVATQTGLTEGTYTVSVRDSNRCTTNTIFVSLKSINPLPVKPIVTQVANSTLVVNQTTGIQWYIRSGSNPDAPVPNATGTTLIPYASGQYYVVVTQNGCASPPSDPFNFILTALSEPTESLSIRVVPNPVSDRLRVELDQPERSGVQVDLLDASGRAVRSYQIPSFSGKKQVEWALEKIPSGTYLLKAAAESRQSVVRVLVE